jgi:hypothetical protein
MCQGFEPQSFCESWPMGTPCQCMPCEAPRHPWLFNVMAFLHHRQASNTALFSRPLSSLFLLPRSCPIVQPKPHYAGSTRHMTVVTLLPHTPINAPGQQQPLKPLTLQPDPQQAPCMNGRLWQSGVYDIAARQRYWPRLLCVVPTCFLILLQQQLLDCYTSNCCCMLPFVGADRWYPPLVCSSAQRCKSKSVHVTQSHKSLSLQGSCCRNHQAAANIGRSR